MRRLTTIFGAILVIGGIFVEGLYTAASTLSLGGVTLSRTASLVAGLILIFVGLLTIFVAERIPKLRPLHQ